MFNRHVQEQTGRLHHPIHGRSGQRSVRFETGRQRQSQNLRRRVPQKLLSKKKPKTCNFPEIMIRQELQPKQVLNHQYPVNNFES